MDFFNCLGFILILPNAVGLILPITNSNGDPDMDSIINHMTLMEQTITSLQSQVQTSNTDIAILKHDLQKCPDLVEFDKLKSEVQSLKASHGGSTQQMNSTVINTISADVKSNMREMQSELLVTKMAINKTTSDLKVTQRQLTYLSSQLLGSNTNISKTAHGDDVAFQVSQESYGSASWTILKFNTVSYNAGGGYDNTTGMFTAPLSGTYIFWLTVDYDDNDHNSYASIRHGQALLAEVFSRPAGASSDSRTVSVTTVTHLDQGDQIHFFSDGGFIHGFGLSSYGGALLRAF